MDNKNLTQECLEQTTVCELRKAARDLGISYPNKLKKDTLIKEMLNMMQPAVPKALMQKLYEIFSEFGLQPVL